jgi:hypothetical protein
MGSLETLRITSVISQQPVAWHSSLLCSTPHLQEGDSVVIGETEFEWSDNRSERAMYDAWLKDMDARGANLQGSARWPSSRPRSDS